MQHEISAATIIMEQAAKEVEQGNQAVNRSGEVFHTISKSIGIVMQGMRTVSAATKSH